MKFIRLLLAAWLGAPGLAAAAPGAVVTTPQVRAELVAHAPAGVVCRSAAVAGPEDRAPAPLAHLLEEPGRLRPADHAEWTLPAGVVAGDVEWPTPSKLPIGPLMNYGYEGTLLLPVAVTVPPDFKADTLSVKLRAEWLVCKDVCIPEEGEFALDLPAQAATAGHAALFAAARAALPQPVPGARATAAVEGGALVVRVAGLPADWHGPGAHFLSRDGGRHPQRRPAAERVAGRRVERSRAAGPATQRLAAGPARRAGRARPGRRVVGCRWR